MSSSLPSREHRLAVSTLSNLGLRALSMALGLVSVRLLVDSVGPSRYGLFVLATSLLGYFSLLGLGLPGAVIKFVADCRGKNDEEEMSRVVSSAMGFYVMVGVAVAFVLVGIAFFGLHLFQIHPKDIPTARRILFMAGIWSLVSWPMQAYGQTLQGLQEFHRYNIAAGFSAILLNVLYISLALADLPIEGALIALMISQVILFAMNLRTVKGVCPNLVVSPWRFEWLTFRRLLGFSLWMLVLALTGMIVFEAQQALVAAFVSAAAVTLYTVLATPMMAIRQWNGMVLVAAMPAIAEAHTAQDHGFVESLVIRGSRFNLLLIGGLLVSAAAVAYPALSVWMGPDYAKYAGLCRILLLSYLLIAPFSIIGQSLMGIGHVRMMGCIALTVAIVSVSATLALITHWKIKGVVIATLISSTLMFTLTLTFYLRPLRVSSSHFLTRLILPSYAILGGLGFALWRASFLLGPKPHLFPTLLFTAAGTGGLILIAGLILLPREDKRMIIALILQSVRTLTTQRLTR